MNILSNAETTTIWSVLKFLAMAFVWFLMGLFLLSCFRWHDRAWVVGFLVWWVGMPLAWLCLQDTAPNRLHRLGWIVVGSIGLACLIAIA